MTTFATVFGQAAPAGGGGIAAFLPMILVLVVAYFLILRPQMKRQKEHQKMISALDKGDRIVTAGGIHGTIIKSLDENTVLVKIADDVKVVLDRSAIARQLTADSSTTPSSTN